MKPLEIKFDQEIKSAISIESQKKKKKIKSSSQKEL
jgi:hypothetical protein